MASPSSREGTSWSPEYTDRFVVHPLKFGEESYVATIIRGDPDFPLPADHPACRVYARLMQSVDPEASIRPLVVTPGGGTAWHGAGDLPKETASLYQRVPNKERDLVAGIGRNPSAIAEGLVLLVGIYGLPPAMLRYVHVLIEAIRAMDRYDATLLPFSSATDCTYDKDDYGQMKDEARETQDRRYFVNALPALREVLRGAQAQLRDDETQLQSVIDAVLTACSNDDTAFSDVSSRERITDTLYVVKYILSILPSHLAQDRVQAWVGETRESVIKIFGPLGSYHGERVVEVPFNLIDALKEILTCVPSNAVSIRPHYILSDAAVSMPPAVFQQTMAQILAALPKSETGSNAPAHVIDTLCKKQAACHRVPPQPQNAKLPMVDLSPARPIGVVYAPPGSGKTTLLHALLSVLAALRTGQGAPVSTGSTVHFAGQIIDAMSPDPAIADSSVPGITQGQEHLSNFQRIAAAITRFLLPENRGSVLLMDDTAAAEPRVLFALMHGLNRYLKQHGGDRFALVAQHTSEALTVDLTDEQFAALMVAFNSVAAVSREILSSTQDEANNIGVNWLPRHQDDALQTLRQFRVPEEIVQSVEQALKLQ